MGEREGVVITKMMDYGKYLFREQKKLSINRVNSKQAEVKTINLTSTEMGDLIDRLFACEMPYTTSSGKPTLITYGLDELNERFER